METGVQTGLLRGLILTPCMSLLDWHRVWGVYQHVQHDYKELLLL